MASMDIYGSGAVFFPVTFILVPAGVAFLEHP